MRYPSLASLVTLACSASPSPPALPLPPLQPSPPPLAASDNHDDAEVRALITEVLTPQLCPRLLGSFVGLPAGDDTAQGPSAGQSPSAGRWWVRTCTASESNGRLLLSMGGPGWTWVDREAQGFRVRQYLLFEADASLGADVSVGYDRTRRIASLWLTPAAGVTAQVTPRGLVSAEPMGFFSRILGGVAAVTGSSIDDRARAQAADIGSTQLRERLSAGFTLTYDLASRQMDFMVGALARGEVPQRPFPNDTAFPWIVNQRARVWPTGLDVVGPLAVGVPMGMDIALEDGDGVSVREVCSDPLAGYFDQRFRDPSSTPTPPAGTEILRLATGPGVRHVSIAPQACTSLLLFAPLNTASDTPVRVRYRIAPEGPNNTVSTVTLIASRVRVEIVGVSINAQNSAGHAWDLVGGDADPFVVTASVPEHREIDRTPTVQNNNHANWDRWLPGAYQRTRDLPLRFTVYDEDPTTNEFVGTVDFTADTVRSLGISGGEQPMAVALPLWTTEAVPTQTGVLRLRVQSVE